jgi:hypothetical protein
MYILFNFLNKGSICKTITNPLLSRRSYVKLITFIKSYETILNIIMFNIILQEFVRCVKFHQRFSSLT